jgi:hypothetical protein
MKDFKKIDIDEVPVYHARFKEVVDKIKLILKDFQHDLQIVQKQNGGVTSSVEVIITLTK